jgi:hypothetical protein
MDATVGQFISETTEPQMGMNLIEVVTKAGLTVV